MPLSLANLSHSNLSGANLKHSNLSGASLKHTNLSGAHLEHTNLSGAHLEHSDLSGANLSLANLNNSVIESTSLKNATLYLATLIASQIRHSNLEGSNMLHTDLRNANVSDSCLVGADLQMCRCDLLVFTSNKLRHARIHIRNLDKWLKINPMKQNMIIDCDQGEDYNAITTDLDGYCVSTRLLSTLITGQHRSLAKVRWAMKISLDNSKQENAIVNTLRELGVNIPIDVLGYKEDTLQNRSLAVVLEPLLKAPHHYYFLDKELQSKLEQLLPELTAYLKDWAARIQQGRTIPPYLR